MMAWKLEVPLQGDGRIHEERLIIVGVVDEVVAEFDLGADRKMIIGIIPQLGLGEDHELAVAIGILATPEVDEA